MVAMLFLEFTLASLMIFAPAVFYQTESTAYPGPVPFTLTPDLNTTSEFTYTPEVFGIQSPLQGQALQGSVDVLGKITVDGFEYAELIFGYTGDPTNTWFLIRSFPEPVSGTVLATWDTTQITDGTYDLKLIIRRVDGNEISHTVGRLRVRNYSPIETNTPTPVTPTSTPLPGALPTPTATLTAPPRPTSTPLPTNPATLTRDDLTQSLGKGALGVFGIFALVGLYVLVKKR